MNTKDIIMTLRAADEKELAFLQQQQKEYQEKNFVYTYVFKPANEFRTPIRREWYRDLDGNFVQCKTDTAWAARNIYTLEKVRVRIES